jgi:EmrB/QacA subfamily drug resistance transporter
MARKWWTLLAVCVGIFMLLLDITVVNVALPSIARSLNAGFSDLQWVVDAYALTLAALLLTTGSLGDRLGRRSMFALGLGLFTAASLACALSPSSLFLILARGVQGIGGAAMFATSLALIAQEFHGRDRGTAFGAFGATTGIAVAVGPLVGGLLTTGFSWRAIFYINVPIGLAAIVVTLMRVSESRDPRGGRLDLGGLATFSLGLFALIYALIRGNDEGWGSAPILACLIGAGVLLVAFIVIERAQRDPMLDLTLFRKTTFVGASAAAFAISSSIFALFLYITLYLQGILGFTALEAGIRFLPISLLSFVAAAASGKATETVPVRFLLAGGLAFVGIGLLLMRGLTAASTWTSLLVGMCVCGVGIGLVNPPLASTAIGVVAPAQSGMASGINSTFRQVGIATGIAALGAVFQHQVANGIHAALGSAGGHAAALARAVSAGATGQAARRVPPALRPRVEHAAHAAFASALNDVFLIGAVLALAGALASLALVRRSDFVVSGGEAEAVAAAA